MTRIAVLVAFLLAAAGTASAQTELRTAVGYSDSAFWTGGERELQYEISLESGRSIRYGIAFQKEGGLLYEGWGVEFYGGKRGALGAGFTGTLRAGGGIRMHGPSTARFTEDAGGDYRQWEWRTLRLNAPLVRQATVYPFFSLGLQRDVLGPFFLDARVRLSAFPTLTQRAVGVTGDMQVQEKRSWAFVPGYHVGLGVRF
ncbi:MAG TPA: hypothetical protein VD862_02790 [Candidatus Paceibacterota bacterium]|nr:hypothetical protein [Candidatus Paceibacterota bacterium]